MASSRSAQDQTLQCNLCQNLLKQPRTLQQCLHSFCRACLDATPKKIKEGQSGWFCPECSNFSEEDDFRENSFVEDLILLVNGDVDKVKNEKVKCTQCLKMDKEATKRCTDCKLELCVECQEIHLRIPILKDHKLTNLDPQTDQTVIDKLIFCPVHESKPVEFNCHNCQQLICQTCILTAHNTHCVETVTQAIDLLQPDIDLNSEAIKLNVKSIEAQIAAISNEIDKTKEAYSSCRLELDERLETLVNRLKATKATMEDEVTEQETIALDILENVKQNLENQLSVAKNLINLIEVTTDKARHASFLHEMQHGLYSRVKENGSTRQQSVNFEINVPKFKDDKTFNIKLSEIQKLIGVLDYSENVSTVNTEGLIWTQSEFLCKNLTEVFFRNLKKEMEIKLNVTWCNRLSFFDDKLWGCCSESGEIWMFDKCGKHLKTVLNDKEITSVKKVHNRDIIAAGIGGLYVTNSECSEWKKLSDGEFSDIFVFGDTFSALDIFVESPKVITFAFRKKHNAHDYNWVEELNFQLSLDDGYDKDNTLMIDNKSQYIISTDCNIHIYSSKGEHLETVPAKWYPSFCGKDSLGKILTANYSAGELYLTDTVTNLNHSNFSELCCNKEIKCENLRDVVVASDSSIWYLVENEDDSFRLEKYVPF